MTCDLHNKTAIVTGAGQGLGKAIAFTLAGAGAKIVLVDINPEKLKSVSSELDKLGCDCLSLEIDVSSNEQLETLIRETIKQFGGIDILVNNAGICPRTALMDIGEQEWDNVLAINLKSVFLLSRLVLQEMKAKQSGRIINMASGAGKVGGVQVGAHYSASKAGIICLTKTLALEGAGYGVNVNAICPGVIETEMTTAISSDRIETYKRMIPLGRLGTPQDVANAVLFLSSDLSIYITGEILDVNGGFIMD